MTKQELLNRVSDIYSKLGEAQIAAKNLANELSDIESMIEDLPEDVEDIKDDKPSE